MSKNLTRKGLALGAIVALGATVFAGSPAFAANELNVVPAAGTSYNAVAGSVFNLATTFAPGFTPSSYAQLKYIVTSDANSAIHYGVGVSAVTSPATAQAVSLSSSAVTATGAGATTVNYIGLSADTASVTSSVVVTAFVDANNDGAVSAGEWNTVKTVTFKKLADITPVVTLAQPSTGDTTVSATVAWGDLNVEQANRTTYLTATGSTNSALGVEFNVAGAGYPTAAATGVSYSSTTGKFSKTVSALASAATVAARAVYATNTFTAGTPNVDAYTSTLLGSAASASATARTINTTNGLVANVVKGNDATGTSATAIATGTAAVVRTNGSFTAQVKAYDTTATTALAAKGVAVVGTVTATTTATDLRPASTGVTEISVTVNGTKYTSETALNAATFALTTDASGLASINISSVGLSAGDQLTVAFAAQNITSSVLATETDATYTASDDNASTVVAANKNTATTLSYSVKDQFGVLSALTNQRLVVTANTAATVTQYIAVVAGKATAVITPVTDSTADISVGAALQASTTASNGNVTWGSTINTVSNTIVTRSAAYSFTVAPAIDATNGINGGAWTSAGAQKQTLTTADQSNTADAGYVAPAASTTWAKVTLTGSNAGEKLTVSGTGVFLSIDGATVAKDSATKVAQGASAVIYVASNTTGAKTLTVTNGSVSATVVVTFDKAGSTAGAKVALGDLAALSQAGRSVDVSAVLVDQFGNPVQGATVTLSATGVGYLANNGTVTSDASGKVTAKLIVGAAETGDAVVTASSTLADATVATASKTITFGSTDANIDIVNNRVTAVATFTKGKTVAFYVDGIKKWSKTSASDADVVLNYNLKKGTHTVAVKISGGFSAVEKFIVK
jgi:trimeric autotransporter adhesin